MTANQTNNTHSIFKVVLLGEGCVGKTSLLMRYIEDKFTDNHLSTLQATFLNKKINVNGRRVHLSIWDTAGQERFHALGPIYYRNSDGAILVYDVTDEDTFSKVKNWVKELKKMLGSEICLVIAGNKYDLKKDMTVPMIEAESYASSVGAKHVYTSAKLNEGVEELFLQLTEQMLDRSDQVAVASSARQNSRVIIVDDEEQPSSSCCGGGNSTRNAN